MKKIIFVAIVFLAISCQEKSKISETTPLESFTDSLFQASVDSSQIAGASVLVFQNGKTLLKKTNLC